MAWDSVSVKDASFEMLKCTLVYKLGFGFITICVALVDS